MRGPRELKYLDVKDHILHEIGGLAPGTPLRPERDLAAAHRVSRTTVRKAVTELVAEGRLTRRQGSGTYVAEAKIAWPLGVPDTAGRIGPEGATVRTALISAERHRAEPELAERLGIRTGGQVLSLELLRSVNGTPLAIEQAHLSARRYPGLAAAVLRTGSLTASLSEHYDVRVAHAIGTIETTPAGPREAALLHTDTGAPMLLLSQHGHTAEGEPVTWARTCYRGDRAAFTTLLTAQETPPQARVQQQHARAVEAAPPPEPRAADR